MDFGSGSISDEYIISQTCHQFSSLFEIDTLRLFLKWNLYDDESLKHLIRLSNAEKNNYGSYKGKYRGFYISISDKGVTITGSISNFYCGHVNILPHSKLRNAISKLGEELMLNLHQARLYRVDININVKTDQPSSRYTNHLFVNLSRFKRLEQGNGVRFQNNSMTVLCYDKSKELYDKRGINVSNWYRIEFRILKNVKKLVGTKTVQDLYEDEHFYKLLRMFKKYYVSIRKQRVPDLDFRAIRNTKEYERRLLLIGIQAKGGEKEVFREIEQLDQQGVFNDRNQKYRLKSKVNELMNFKSLTIMHPLVAELNKKFKNAYEQELVKI